MYIRIYKNKTDAVGKSPIYPFVSLYQDNWDDYGWRCRFVATLHLKEDKSVELGALRISSDDKGFRADKIPSNIDKLPSKTASLGESIVYYRRLRDVVPEKDRKKFLSLMQDILAKPERRDRIKNDNLWENAFMRSTYSRHAFERGAFYLGGHPSETDPPAFTCTMKLNGAAAAHILPIDFGSHKELPHRITLLIGPNGTGKTKALSAIALGLIPNESFDQRTTDLALKVEVSATSSVSRVIAISYNVFDEFPLPRVGRGPRLAGASYRSNASYKYCGLRSADGTINAGEVGKMLSEALEPVASSEREDVLERVLSTILTTDLARHLCASEEERSAAISELSAGQRLVVAIFCNIIGFIEEGSLLLIDEPETNLHPGLLTSFIIALDDVLKEFDSFAIIATHSPILLQQVPTYFVRVFLRDDNYPRVMLPSYETFGEDLGELTRKSLGLATHEADYSLVLDRLFAHHKSVEAVESLFLTPLGLPAKAHLFGLEEDSFPNNNNEI